MIKPKKNCPEVSSGNFSYLNKHKIILMITENIESCGDVSVIVGILLICVAILQNKKGIVVARIR